MAIDKAKAEAEAKAEGNLANLGPSQSSGKVRPLLRKGIRLPVPKATAKVRPHESPHLIEKADPFFGKKRWHIFPLVILCAVVLASCGGPTMGPANPARSIRPVTKIGLIAPFEGLYRRSGYEALTAMRAAISDHSALIQSAKVDILPLALDDSGHPANAARTAKKLVADPAVAAVIGPISPSTKRAASDTLNEQRLFWVPPYLAGQPEAVWLRQLLLAVNAAAKGQGAERLVVYGERDEWSQAANSLLPTEPLLAVEFVDQLQAEAIRATDAVLFLGTPADAATALSLLRQHHTDVPFWMGPQGGDPIFFERAARVDGVCWATVLDSEYDEWRTQNEPSTPAAYQVYRATVEAIYAVVGRSDGLVERDWQVRLFRVEPNGVSVAYDS